MEGAATEPDSEPEPGSGLRVPPSQTGATHAGHVTLVLSHCRQLSEVFAVLPTAAPAQNWPRPGHVGRFLLWVCARLRWVADQ